MELNYMRLYLDLFDKWNRLKTEGRLIEVPEPQNDLTYVVIRDKTKCSKNCEYFRKNSFSDECYYLEREDASTDPICPNNNYNVVGKEPQGYELIRDNGSNGYILRGPFLLFDEGLDYCRGLDFNCYKTREEAESVLNEYLEGKKGD